MKKIISQFLRRFLGGFWPQLLSRALDVVFPRAALVRRLEQMDARFALRFLPLSGLRHDGMFAVFTYRSEFVKALVWEVKYRKNVVLARLCAECIWKKFFSPLSVVAALRVVEKPVFVPVPLAPRRRRERGYNQNELVLRELEQIFKERNVVKDATQNDSKRFSVTYDFVFDALIKTRETKPQSSLGSRAERLKNLNGCFVVVKPEVVHGRTVILFDDVMTTGSTVKEARAGLFAAGAHTVLTIVLAH